MSPPVENTVDRWGYLGALVDEHVVRDGAVWKPGDNWGRRVHRRIGR